MDQDEERSSVKGQEKVSIGVPLHLGLTGKIPNVFTFSTLFSKFRA